MEDISLVVRRCKRSNDTKIVLSNRGLFSIPQDIYNLTQLQNLELKANKITSIDPKISNLTQLKVLDLSSNSLMEIPSEISKLPQLEQLILSGNPLSSEFEIFLKPENQMGSGLQSAFKKVFNSNLSNNNFLPEKKEEYKQNNSLQNKVTISSSTSSKYGGVMEVEANEFEMGEIISQGGFSIVHHAVLRGTDVALKKIFNPNITQDLMSEIENEIEMLAKLRHPNIILLMAVTTKPPNLYIATEFMPKGSLFQLLHKSRITVTEPQKLKIAIQICRVLLYLHQSGIVHRDIKSHNILLDENYKIKLCDFGLARKMVDFDKLFLQKEQLNQGTMQFSGTPSYMAPELFQKRAYDKGVDSFAYGTLLWEIFAREVPYEGIDPQDIAPKVMKGEPLQMKSLPKSIWQLVCDLRSVDSQKRPSMENVLIALQKISL